MTRDSAKDTAWQAIRADTKVIQQVIYLSDKVFNSIEEVKKVESL